MSLKGQMGVLRKSVDTVNQFRPVWQKSQTLVFVL